MVILITIIVFLFTRIFFITRFGFNSAKTTGDSIGHLNILKNIYENNGKIVDLKQYIFDTNDYPNGFHKIIYILKIPISVIEKYGSFIPSIFDGITLLSLIYFVLKFGGENIGWLILYPLLVIFIHNDGRAFYFGERSFGTMLGSIYLVSSSIYVYSNSLIFLSLAILCFTILSTSAKFALQAVIFITIVYSFLTMSHEYVLLLLICVLISFILTRGYSLKVIMGLIRHSSYIYKRMNIMKYSFSSYNQLLKILFSFNTKKIINVLYYNPVCLIFTGFSISPLLIHSFFSLNVVPNQLNWVEPLVLSGFVLTLLISFKSLKFLGEPERYLEFIVIPAFIMLTYVPIQVNIYSLISILLLIFGLFLKLSFLYKSKRHTNIQFFQDQDSLIKFANKLENKIILCVDLRLSFLLGYYNRNVKFVTIFGNIGINKEDLYTELVPVKYPFPNSDFSFF